jgi:xylan 1,4-beta-xylosidase
MKVASLHFAALAVTFFLFQLANGFSQSAQPEGQASPSAPILVQVHGDKHTGLYRPIWNFFGADEPNYIYAPNGRKLLGELAALSPIPVYFRAHNLFTTGNGDGSLKWGSTNVYTERADGTPIYDFAITDRIFDALIAAHVRPLVEIGFMPEALSTHPKPYRHDFPEGEVFTGWSYPPRDEAKWSALVVAYVTHLRDRYGSQTADWLWEVWNEPDIAYWHGTPEQYNRLYDFTAAAIRQVLPHARIGGPEATGVSDHSEPFLRQFLEHCAHGENAATGGTGAPLDFVSYHPKGAPKIDGDHLMMSIATQLRAVERGMKVVASYPEWKHTPIILGESDPEGCGACLSPRGGYRNTSLYAASVAEATMCTYELARKYGVTVEGAVTWAFEFENQPAFAGYRELATHGIDKPVLNAFRLMGMLGSGTGTTWLATQSGGALPLEQVVADSVRVTPDVNAVATRNGREVAVLLWNYHDADLPAPLTSIVLAVDGLRGTEVLASEFRVDAMHSNAFSAWKQMGSPAQPTATQIVELEKAGALEQSQPDHAVSLHEGKVNLGTNVPRQGVVLIRLRER